MNDPDLPALIEGGPVVNGDPAANPPGEPQSVRDAYDALADKSGRKRGGR
jgi:hypothetical protein